MSVCDSAEEMSECQDYERMRVRWVAKEKLLKILDQVFTVVTQSHDKALALFYKTVEDEKHETRKKTGKQEDQKGANGQDSVKIEVNASLKEDSKDDLPKPKPLPR